MIAAGAVDDHESAAADIAGARIGYRHGEADRDRGVDRVAAPLQNVDADPRGERLLRYHHPVLGGNGRGAADLRRRTVVAAREERQRQQCKERDERQALVRMSVHGAN